MNVALFSPEMIMKQSVTVVQRYAGVWDNIWRLKMQKPAKNDLLIAIKSEFTEPKHTSLTKMLI